MRRITMNDRSRRRDLAVPMGLQTRPGRLWRAICRMGLPTRPGRLARGRLWRAILRGALLTAWVSAATALAQEVEAPLIPPALRAIDAPVPPNLGDFVADRQAAVALGKALFWDIQTGGDGKVACATCHFHAGADNRVKNTVGLPPNPSGVVFRGANRELSAGDFPFHQLLDFTQPESEANPVVFDTAEVIGSQGVVRKNYVTVRPASDDRGTDVPDPVFSWEGANCRQVTGRNTPSVINAVFNDRNFWDGRAQRFFNGVNPFGDMDPSARVWKYQNRRKQAVRVLLDNASLASQAVGPPNNSVEMSWNGREFPALARKLLYLKPLALQAVHPRDSVLGAMAKPGGKGLAPQHTYAAMIRQAFRPEWWDAPSSLRFPVGRNRFTLMEINFSLFWGLAVQAYETTLVSDDSKFDRWRRGQVALSAEETEGLNLFLGPGRCTDCHDGAEFSNAAARLARDEPIEGMVMSDGQVKNYDSGFYNIGVRPTDEDLGVGGLSPFGGPLSLTRRNNRGEALLYANLVPPSPTRPTAVDGSFKSPSLRNVELTGPYMHNGGIARLEDVVWFYARGTDFLQENIDNADPDVGPIAELVGPDLPQAERERRVRALVAFLKTLTDERVRWQLAPFDHPELPIPQGLTQTVAGGSGTVNVDGWITLPAVGAGGAGQPLRAFEDVLPP